MAVDHEEFCRLLFPAVASSAARHAQEHSARHNRIHPEELTGGGSVEGSADKGAAGDGDVGTAAATTDGDGGDAATIGAHASPVSVAGGGKRQQPAAVNSWQAAVGSARWHEWHRSARQDGCFRSPVAPCTGGTSALESAAEEPATSVASLVDTARREAASLRRRYQQEGDRAGSPRGSPSRTRTAAAGGSSGRVEELHTRMGQLESQMGRVLALLESQAQGQMQEQAQAGLPRAPLIVSGGRLNKAALLPATADAPKHPVP